MPEFPKYERVSLVLVYEIRLDQYNNTTCSGKTFMILSYKAYNYSFTVMLRTPRLTGNNREIIRWKKQIVLQWNFH